MAIEIERKFLARSGRWQALVVRSSHITDGLLLKSADRTRRVRDDRATLACKGARSGLARDEFEYPIPLEDARHLLARQCEDRILSKTRHKVPYRGFLWEVDVYDAPLAGVILVELELTDEAAAVPLPDWLGAEVTGQQRYRKIDMLAGRSAALADAKA